ncbi:MAG TPA: hypothetical protein VFX33_01140, partial [Actinomycetales bacterium]|nr:hypothetical protein [Actinomycetales bacterium]HEX5532326.1 hypothetical protein [Actinomycetales bacterium]
MSSAETARATGGPVVLRRWLRSPLVADGVLALSLTVMAQVELVLADGVEGPMVAQSVSFAAMTMAVAWRRSVP